MRRIKLTVAYDGTNYCGWQVQPNGITVEEVLNRALSALTGTKVNVIGRAEPIPACMPEETWQYLIRIPRFHRTGSPMR